MQPLEAMLEVAAYPDATISSMSFNFWNALAHNLTTGFSEPADGIANGQVSPRACWWDRDTLAAVVPVSDHARCSLLASADVFRCPGPAIECCLCRPGCLVSYCASSINSHHSSGSVSKFRK